MPTKQKNGSAKKGTGTKVAVKTGVKTSTLVALAWAVAFASMGLAASASNTVKTPHFIGSFTELKHNLKSDYIASAHPTQITPHKVKRTDAFQFEIKSSPLSQRLTNRRYAFSTITYPRGQEPEPTALPSEALIAQAAQRLTWGKNNKIDFTPPLATKSSVVDVVGFTGIESTNRRVLKTDDHAVIRLIFTTVASSQITVVKNNAFTDRNANNPTGVTNQPNVKIASFIIQGTPHEAVDLTRIELKDAKDGPPLGANFQNLKIMRGGTPLGNTISTLHNEVLTNPYTFNPSPALRIAKDESFVVDVYADIKPNSATPEKLLNPVMTVDGVYATGFNTGGDSSNLSDVNLQTAYISLGGTLHAFTSANTPLAQQLVMGSTRVPMATFQITADAAEPVRISHIAVSDFLNGPGAIATLKNIRLIGEQGNQVGATIGTLSVANITLPGASSTAFALFSNLNETIEPSQTKQYTVQADITNLLESGVAQTGQQHRLFLAAHDYDGVTSGYQGSIGAVGVISGTALNENAITYNQSGTTDANQFANTMILYRTKLGIRWANDTPSGAASGGSEQTIAKLIVSNTANVGSYDATLNTLDATLNGTIRHTAPRNVRVYKDTVATANKVAENTWAVGSTYNGSTAFELNGRIFRDTLISAGSSRTFIITADTTDAATNDRLAISVKQGQVVWSDGATAATIGELNDIPLSPEVQTLTY